MRVRIITESEQSSNQIISVTQVGEEWVSNKVLSQVPLLWPLTQHLPLTRYSSCVLFSVWSERFSHASGCLLHWSFQYYLTSSISISNILYYPSIGDQRPCFRGIPYGHRTQGTHHNTPPQGTRERQSISSLVIILEYESETNHHRCRALLVMSVQCSAPRLPRTAGAVPSQVSFVSSASAQ